MSRLLLVKDVDIRITTLKQGLEAIDHGVHIGGAFSSVVPLVSLFYGGFMNYDVSDPVRPGQDQFVLSKGHAVAAMASIYADVGYFSADLLKNSRSAESILNGHPGPILPGVSIATGPLGQGLCVAEGFAVNGKRSPSHDVFCITGDGELQEGIVWEAFMQAPKKRLDNFCVIVDKNEGQLDSYNKLLFPMDNLPEQIKSFGWNVVEVDGTSYPAVLEALRAFSAGPRDGRPTAIISHTQKGHGAFSEEMNKHKISVSQSLYEQERALQSSKRDSLYREWKDYLKQLKAAGEDETAKQLEQKAVDIGIEGDTKRSKKSFSGKVAPRDKRISFDESKLPAYGSDEQVAANNVIEACMPVFAQDERVMSVDADLGSTSGLSGGIGAVDQSRALNIGIAEANMMCIGEAFAATGANAWVSTFCPFFNWQVMRRIAVGAQEREEAISGSEGWLSEGHGLDLTFVATAANLDTQVNGATHMGNDDNLFFSAVAGLKIIDVSCPNQLVSILKWIMEGGKGLVYLRLMRKASGVLYEPGVEFSYGTAYPMIGEDNPEVVFISSGRGVHEAKDAAKQLAADGVTAEVYDMPSFDGKTFAEVAKKAKLVVCAEQNNGYLYQLGAKYVMQNQLQLDLSRIVPVNMADADGTLKFIHSATYDQLIEQGGLTPKQLVRTVKERLS
ncbi:MAG: transketolase C-terminal domain-containing protein [Spirochaetota bacterium]